MTSTSTVSTSILDESHALFDWLTGNNGFKCVSWSWLRRELRLDSSIKDGSQDAEHQESQEGAHIEGIEERWDDVAEEVEIRVTHVPNGL